MIFSMDLGLIKWRLGKVVQSVTSLYRHIKEVKVFGPKIEEIEKKNKNPSIFNYITSIFPRKIKS